MTEAEHIGDLLPDYLNDALPPAARAHVEAHLSACADCRAALIAEQRLAAAMRARAEHRAVTVPPLHVPSSNGFHPSYSYLSEKEPSMTVLPLRPAARRLTFTLALAFAACLALLVLLMPRLPFAIPLAQQQATPQPPLVGVVTATPLVVVATAVEPQYEVVVPTRLIRAGETIPADALTTANFPQSSAPVNAYLDVSDVVGYIARTDLRCGLPVLATVLVNDLNQVAHTLVPSQPSPACPDAAAVGLVPVVIAVQTLPAGFQITRETVDVRFLPASQVTPDLYSDVSQVIGRTVARDVHREEVLTPEMFLPVGMPVLVAAQDIPFGTQISAEMLTPALFTGLDGNPMEYAQSLQDVVGSYAVRDVRRWEPLRVRGAAADVGTANPLAPGTDGALWLPAGRLAVAIPLPDGARVSAGQSVDVVAALLFVDVDGTLQAPAVTDVPADVQPRTVVQRLATGARVLNVLDAPNGRQAVTLAVTADEARVLVWAVEAQLPLGVFVRTP